MSTIVPVGVTYAVESLCLPKLSVTPSEPLICTPIRLRPLYLVLKRQQTTHYLPTVFIKNEM